MTMVRITTQEMHDFSRYIAEISGIAIDPGKKYLLETRLQPLLAAQQCGSFYELLFSVRNVENSTLRSRLIDAIATNETYFFRDQTPFAILSYKILPEIIDRKRRQNLPGKVQIRIWCAGCSTGQEVYSVIMAILETVPEIDKYDIRVLGTDISSRVIARASSGRYSQHELERGLPKGLLEKYFAEENGLWRVRDQVRMLASFSRLNLLDMFYGIGPFDVIFCRNVSIYFAEENKVELFKKIARLLDREGYLIVGGSESLSEIAPQFSCRRHLKGMFYQRQDAAPPPLSARRTAPVVKPVPTTAAPGGSRLLRPARPALGPTGTGARRLGAAETGRGSRAAAGADEGKEGPAKPGAVPLINRDRAGRGAVLSAAEPPGDRQALLEFIRKNRQGGAVSTPVWERKGAGEGRRSLLDSLYEGQETEGMPGGDAEAGGGS